MVRTTPFHARLSELNATGLYVHWQGHLSALRYTHSAKHEYFAVRNAVGVFDTSPLCKYWLRGRDAERLLAGMLVRDVRACRPGHAHYTLWCDDRGFVTEDGVVFRHGPGEFFMTTARPNFGYLTDLRGRLQVDVEDVTDEYGMLAVQGPRSAAVLETLVGADVRSLRFFDHIPAKVAGAPVTLSRTGFTGDLGFELAVPAMQGLDVLDAVLAAGVGHGIRPLGEQTLMTLRIEAGLPLVDVEFRSSRLAFTDADRVTPKELGMGWMLRGVGDDDRPFVGRDAIRRELREGSSRWATVGVVADWQDWDRVHRDAGLLPPKDEHPLPYESMLYDDDGSQVGYATSFAYSPVLQRHVGIARVRPAYAAAGTAVRMELAVTHANTTVLAHTCRLPHFDPARKTEVLR